jgi:hypothetical protein
MIRWIGSMYVAASESCPITIQDVSAATDHVAACRASRGLNAGVSAWMPCRPVTGRSVVVASRIRGGTS